MTSQCDPLAKPNGYTCVAEKGGLQAGGFPRLHSEFKASLGNLMRLRFKIESSKCLGM